MTSLQRPRRGRRLRPARLSGRTEDSVTPSSGQGSRKEGTKAGENQGCRERVEAGPRRLLSSEDSDTGGQGHTHRTRHKGVPLATGQA